MRASTLEELPSWAMALLRDARVAHLGMLDEKGAPRVLPVTFTLHEGALWTAIDLKPKRDPLREPARVRYLRRDARAALTVDRYDDDWSGLAWVQVLGEITVREAGGEQGALDALTVKYPRYRAERPPGPLLRMTPGRALCWSARSG